MPRYDQPLAANELLHHGSWHDHYKLMKDDKKLEWDNLLDGFCPKCDGTLIEGEKIVKCDSCSFKMTKDRYDELLAELEAKQVEDNREEDLD